MTRKIQFGCGGNRLDGWENHDMEVPIDRPLPFRNDTVNFILAEHVIEHVLPIQALEFLHGCYRILVQGGVIRVAVPSLTDVLLIPGARYDQIIAQKLGRADCSRRASMMAVIQDWGHKSWWDAGILEAVLLTVGFRDVVQCTYGHSQHAELRGVDWHLTGYDLADMDVMRRETVTMEAVK